MLPNPTSQLSGKNQANRLTNQFGQLEFYNDSDELLQYLFSQSHSIATNFYNDYNPNRPPVQKPASKLEQHLHPSILTPLWNELKKIRPDCAFITISHDLNFIANQTGKNIFSKNTKEIFLNLINGI